MKPIIRTPQLGYTDISASICYQLLHRDAKFFVSRKEQGFSYIMTFEDAQYWVDHINYGKPYLKSNLEDFKQVVEKDVLNSYKIPEISHEWGCIMSMLTGYLLRTKLAPEL